MSRYILSILFSIIFLGGSAFGYSQCPVDPPNASETMDSELVWHWCHSNALINDMWYGLYLNEEAVYWYNVLGYDPNNYCNPLNGLARLFNSVEFMRNMQWHRDNDTFPHAVTRWWEDFMLAKADDTYYYVCNEDFIASNISGGPTELDIPQFFNKTAALRAGTLVHEAVHHDGPGHETLNGRDADIVYGWYNAYTHTIRFALEALGTYRKDPETNRLIVSQLPEGRCSFKPLLNQYSFERSLDRAWNVLRLKIICSPYYANLLLNDSICEEAREKYAEVITHFVNAASALTYFEVYGFEGRKWQCGEVCDPDDYLMGGEHFCRTDINEANHSINERNFEKCQKWNDPDSGWLPPYPIEEDIIKGRAEFEGGVGDRAREACVNTVSDEYLETYCSILIELNPDIDTVDDLKAVYELDDDPNLIVPEYAFEECLGRFCQAKYEDSQDTWKTEARAECYEWDDPAGCLDELCGKRIIGTIGVGDLNWKDYFEDVQCRRHFIELNGNMFGYFTEAENVGKCEQEYTDCVNAQALGEWLEARDVGECSLETFQEALYQKFALQYLDDIEYNTTLEELLAEFPLVALGQCEAEKILCEKNKLFGTEAISKFVAVSEFQATGISFLQPNNYFDLVTRQYANHIATGGDTLPGLSLEQTHKQITQPDNLWSLSKAIGTEALFAVLGSTEKVFGCDTVSYYKDNGANVEFPFELTPEQEALLPELTAVKDIRSRIESENAHNILKSMAESDPEELFTNMQAFYWAETIDVLNSVLDEIGMDQPK